MNMLERIERKSKLNLLIFWTLGILFMAHDIII